jgi:PfaD family protein
MAQNSPEQRSNPLSSLSFDWNGNSPLECSDANVSACLKNLDRPVYILHNNDQCAVSSEGSMVSDEHPWKVTGFAPALQPEMLGDPLFRQTYGLRYPLYGGAMANGIASESFVIALGEAGFMGSYGAGGMLPARIEKAIHTIQEALKEKPFAFNLINSPFEPAMEQRAAELYINNGVRVIEASAYLTLTTNLVWYRAAGLTRLPDGSIFIGNKVIAKVSRKEVAAKFLAPASADILAQLESEGKITPEQAALARMVPMADDITVEADSGGHTDNRPLVGILPSIIKLRDTYQKKFGYPQQVRIGAAGGISTPASALAAFSMGAAFVVTGSVNQACIESGASDHARNLLSQMEITDVAMAPASDMFEMGVKVQVLKRGTMFAMRAQKLYELYQRYDSVDSIPAPEREKLETAVFKRSLDSVWDECVKFFSERDPRQVERGTKNPKDKMALIFRWYLGLSSRWSNAGEKGREMDYQIWCGPSMGAFNDWVRGSYLEDPLNRRAADVACQILTGAAYLQRLRMLESQGIRFSPQEQEYVPEKALI